MVIVGIILILTFLIIFVIGMYLYSKMKYYSRTFFGTESLIEGWKKQEIRLAETPKSVASMTKIYLPMIQKDFPSFNLFEFKQKAETMLKSVFSAIEAENVGLIVGGSEAIKEHVKLYIEDLKSQGITEKYDRVHIHQNEVSRYVKEEGTCKIVLQLALEYYHYHLREGQIIEGKKDLKVQTKYNVVLIYIQDINKVNRSEYQKATGVTCPHCGGPITNLGQKYCAYCGSAVDVIHRKSWVINSYEEV